MLACALAQAAREQDVRPSGDVSVQQIHHRRAHRCSPIVVCNRCDLTTLEGTAVAYRPLRVRVSTTRQQLVCPNILEWGTPPPPSQPRSLIPQTEWATRFCTTQERTNERFPCALKQSCWPPLGSRSRCGRRTDQGLGGQTVGRCPGACTGAHRSFAPYTIGFL